jgi:hypothetical protein
MPEAAPYSAIEVLHDGSRVEIRALRPDDRAAILAAVGHTSERSLYRRFFASVASQSRFPESRGWLSVLILPKAVSAMRGLAPDTGESNRFLEQS